MAFFFLFFRVSDSVCGCSVVCATKARSEYRRTKNARTHTRTHERLNEEDKDIYTTPEKRFCSRGEVQDVKEAVQDERLGG